MKRRHAIRVISFLSAAVLALGGRAVQLSNKTERYRIMLQNGYSRSLDDFGTAIGNISDTLNKTRFVTTPEQVSDMAATLVTQAELSKNALSQLPRSFELETLNRFLSQVGNYALSVSKSLINGGTLTAGDAENIEELSGIANKISQLVSDSQITFGNADYWAKELDKKVESITSGADLANSLNELNKELSDYPTLIYDGPYSDRILEKEPEMTKNAPEVTEAEALETAAKTANIAESGLSYDGLVAGEIAAYRFVGEDLSVTVSRNGGYPVYMRRETAPGQSILSCEQAREKAKRYLERIGMSGFTETYYFTSEGVCLVNFAFVDGETVCYTDLVKVGIDMSDGETVLYEASGYLANHRERAFETPTYSAEDAEKLVSRGLAIKSTALALIPTSGGNEARCYEFACTSSDGQELLIYINAKTLKEEEILLLIKGDGGTLVK